MLGADWHETINTIVFTEDGKTTTTLTVLYPSQKARDAAAKARPMNRAGGI